MKRSSEFYFCGGISFHLFWTSLLTKTFIEPIYFRINYYVQIKKIIFPRYLLPL